MPADFAFFRIGLRNCMASFGALHSQSFPTSQDFVFVYRCVRVYMWMCECTDAQELDWLDYWPSDLVDE